MTELLTFMLALGLVSWAIYLAAAHSAFGLWIGFATLFIVHSFGVSTVFRVGSISLSAGDVASVVLIVAGFGRLLLLPRERPRLGLPVLVFILYATVEACFMLYSAVKYGESSFQLGRSAILQISCIVYLLSFRPSASRLESWFRVFLWYVGAIVCLFVLRVAGLVPAAASVIATMSPGSYTTLRYLVNYQSLAVAYAFFAILMLRWAGRFRGVPMLSTIQIVLLLIVIVVPQRMVWLLLAVGVAYLAYSHTRKAALYLAVLVAAVLVLLPFSVAVIGPGPLDALVAGITGAATDPFENFSSSTGGSRVADWQVLVASTFASGQALVGQGYIPNLTRYSGATSVSYGIHNILVSKFVYGGFVLLGSLALLWVTVLVAFARAADCGVAPVYKEIISFGLVGIVLYSLTSVPGLEMGLVVGICLSIVSHDCRDQALVGADV